MIIHIEFFLHIWMHIDDSYTLLARHGFLLFINWPMKCICKRELEYALYHDFLVYHDFFPKGIVHNLFSWMDWFMAYRQSWWKRGMFPGSLEFAHQAGRQLCSRRAGDFGHCRVVLRGSASAGPKFPPKLLSNSPQWWPNSNCNSGSIFHAFLVLRRLARSGKCRLSALMPQHLDDFNSPGGVWWPEIWNWNLEVIWECDSGFLFLFMDSWFDVFCLVRAWSLQD